MIASVLCSCCDHRYWPDPPPKYPQQWICPSCDDWVAAFSHPPDPWTGPLAGPVKSVRLILAGHPITIDEVLADTSAWVLINTSAFVVNAWQQLMSEKPTATPQLTAVQT